VPELPEVETIRRGLAPALSGKTFAGVDTSWPRAVKAPAPERLSTELAGRCVESIERAGKFLLFRLSGERWLVLHLRMSGSLLLRRSTDPPDRFVRHVFGFTDGTELRFADVRKMGVIWLVDDPRSVTGALGTEPLSARFTRARLAAALARHPKAPVKSVLLGQRAVAGVGNIYADEALWEARIHPVRPAASLAPPEVARLHRAIRSVLREAICNRGTSKADYVDASGEKGAHQFALRAYGRAAEPCTRCGTPIERIRMGGRGTYFCPRCQTPAQLPR